MSENTRAYSMFASFSPIFFGGGEAKLFGKNRGSKLFPKNGGVNTCSKKIEGRWKTKKWGKEMDDQKR